MVQKTYYKTKEYCKVKFLKPLLKQLKYWPEQRLEKFYIITSKRDGHSVLM
jgi:hypothetical protein